MSATVPSSAPNRPQTEALAEPNPWVARAIALAVAAVVVLFLALLIWGLGRKGAGTVGEATIPIRSAPRFALPLFDGGSFDLGSAPATPVLINFWASWCIPCEEEAAALERASRAYHGRVLFVGVNVQDTEPNARAFLKKFGVSYPNGRDASGEIAVEYGMSGVPESYFVGRDGRLTRKWQGPLDDARLGAFLEELLR